MYILASLDALPRGCKLDQDSPFLDSRLFVQTNQLARLGYHGVFVERQSEKFSQMNNGMGHTASVWDVNIFFLK